MKIWTKSFRSILKKFKRISPLIVGHPKNRLLGPFNFRPPLVENYRGPKIKGNKVERTLKTTFAVFGHNLVFMDKYLENRAKIWNAVCTNCSMLISFTFWRVFRIIVNAVFKKKSKTVILNTFLYFLDYPTIFGWSGSVNFFHFFFHFSMSDIMQRKTL